MGPTDLYETAPYVGMIARTSSTAGDSRPNATLDKNHPTTGDCTGCHTDADIQFGSVDECEAVQPHPVQRAVAQCHTTANNYALYSVTGTPGRDQLPELPRTLRSNTFVNVTIVSTTGVNHIDR